MVGAKFVFRIRKVEVGGMVKLVSAIRTIIGLFYFVGICISIIGCVSGPVTTQVNTTKNPVASQPPQFQSPVKSIDGFLDSSNEKTLRDKLVQQIRTRSLKTLLGQQTAVTQELNGTGKLLLQPGYSYEFDLESFCVNAGIERPVKGDGLFLGDMEGAAKSWLPIMLRDYKAKGISQADAQILVWSLLSMTRFDQLSTKNQGGLLKIFPDALVRFGNSFAESHVTSLLLSQVPAELLSAKEKLEKYQEILQDTRSKYSEIEQRLSPFSSRTEPSEVGWLKHEDGYYIHLRADGYQQVHVQIYAPEGLRANTYFEPTKQVALPGQGQRLALSPHVIDHYKDKANQFIKNKTGVTSKEALFILKHPLDALKIYQAAQQALKTTWSHLKSFHNYEDDHADAFRHFFWSGLVTQEIGAVIAQEYLDGHEDFPENNPDSKSMDQFNNGKGIEYSNKYKGNNFENDLIQAGLDKIRDRDLRWIK